MAWDPMERGASVCVCHKIGHDDCRALVLSGAVRSIGQLKQKTLAASNCGLCEPYFEKIIAFYNEALESGELRLRDGEASMSQALEVKGEVTNALDLDFDALAKLPGQIPDISSMVPDRQGGAVPLASVLEAAGVNASAKYATLKSSDGRFAASVPLDGVQSALLLYRDGDAPLPDKFGGPIRFLVPDAAACKTAEVDACANVKFLASIELSAEAGEDTRNAKPGC